MSKKIIVLNITRKQTLKGKSFVYRRYSGQPQPKTRDEFLKGVRHAWIYKSFWVFFSLFINACYLLGAIALCITKNKKIKA